MKLIQRSNVPDVSKSASVRCSHGNLATSHGMCGNLHKNTKALYWNSEQTLPRSVNTDDFCSIGSNSKYREALNPIFLLKCKMIF